MATKTLNIRKETQDGIKFKIFRVKCLNCGGILDIYYLNELYSIPQILKMVVINEPRKKD